jgi:hypothetical protein
VIAAEPWHPCPIHFCAICGNEWDRADCWIAESILASIWH